MKLTIKEAIDDLEKRHPELLQDKMFLFLKMLGDTVAFKNMGAEIPDEPVLKHITVGDSGKAADKLPVKHYHPLPSETIEKAKRLLEAKKEEKK